MPKIKLTKNELKLQRDALKMFERYLPTLQLKKQQLQMEVRRFRDDYASLQEEIRRHEQEHKAQLALLARPEAKNFADYVRIQEFRTGERNIAGIDVPIFESLTFQPAEYDLFLTPPWFDDMLELLRNHLTLMLRHRLLDASLQLLEQELRTVTQRVNLFEKVKIPEARENIRRINIYIGDQDTNSVGRSKIAKAKCEARDAAMNIQLDNA